MADLLSQRAYGKRRGVSHTAVQRAITDGRLVRSVHRHESGKRAGRFLGIDPDLADQEWRELTDPTKPTGPIPSAPAAAPDDGQSLLPGIESDPDPTAPALLDADTIDARRRGITATSVKSLWLAKLAELEYKQKAGELVPVEEIRERYFSVARELRDLLLAIPARLGAILAAESESSTCRTLLEDELRATLETLADNLRKGGAA